MKTFIYPDTLVLTNAIGAVAGVGTTLSFLPQIVRVFKTRSVSGLSIYMFLIHSTGVGLWVAYGVMVNDYIIILFNAITFFFNMIILSFFLQEYYCFLLV